MFVVMLSLVALCASTLLLAAFLSPDDNGGRKLTVEKCQEPTRGQVSKVVVMAENEQKMNAKSPTTAHTKMAPFGSMYMSDWKLAYVFED